MSGVKIISVNKKARMEFAVEDTYEAGMVLTGTEVKSIREGHVSLKESFGDVRDGEVWLVDCHINPYGHGNVHNHETTRIRKLLLNIRIREAKLHLYSTSIKEKLEAN